MPTREEIQKTLSKIKYPGYEQDIVTFGIVRDIKISGGSVAVLIDLRSKDTSVVSQMEDTIKMAISALPGVESVAVETASLQVASPPTPVDSFLSGVKIKIAVASGKGGVGKSTVSVNLAAALARMGLKVGLLDSDIYGPSIPLMLGVTEKPQLAGDKLLPINRHGINLMSLGFLVDDNSPVIWRGPMVMRALQQLMRDVRWGELDIMIFDMPPGTGDAQLTLSQSVALDGAVIVTTPQDVALLDAVKGVQMFQKVNVPILGIVENMSYFICGDCGTRTDIFSAGGAKRESEKLKIDLLGEIPLDIEIRIGGDQGLPVILKNPENPQSAAFFAIAEKIRARFF